MIDLHVGADATSYLPGSILNRQLSGLSTAELMELRQSVAVQSVSDEDSDRTCAQADKLIVAELFLRVYSQAAIDAKAAAIVDEERRLAASSRLAAAGA